jgi:Raf kinase inhibitor-like YbhB/YbcL family protein
MRAVLWCALFVALVQGQMILTSPEFKTYGDIPEKYCCDVVYRDDYRPSPPLSWDRAPVTARSFILVVDDMDNEGFVQWFVKDIPMNVTSLPSGASEVNMPRGAVELTNSRAFDSYAGPCPDHEAMHTYRFRLFAMPTGQTHIKPITEPEALRAEDIVAQIEEDIVYTAVLIGKYYLGRYRPPTPVDVNTHRNVTIVVGNHTNHTVTRQVPIIRAPGPPPLTTRPVIPGQPIVTRRYVKPSEVLKPAKPIAEPEDHDSCAENPATARCIIQRAEAKFRANATKARLSMQALVDQGVEGFKRDVDLWSCEEEFRRNAGVAVAGNETHRCPLRSRVTDSNCANPMFPRQFVCDKGVHGGYGQSPSLMWKDAPEDTQSFVVMMEEASDLEYLKDYGQIYWLVTDIPASQASIVAGASGHEKQMPPLSVELKNSFGHAGYTAPCPGDHERRVYRLRVFAMPHATTRLFLPGPLRSTDVMKVLQKQALCMSTIEVPFSFKHSPVTEMHRVVGEAKVAANEAMAGEVVQE